MATHYRHPTDTRRWRALETILELLTTWVELWVEFWYGTAPTVAAHEASDHGATPRWADTLRNIPIAAVHDHLSDQPGRYERLLGAERISGTELTDVISLEDTAIVDGWTLCGNLHDQLPGA